jgi:hypothetical protein
MSTALISVAVATVRTVLHLTEMYQVQDVRMRELSSRVISLEQPLVALESSPDCTISEQALHKLIDTLEEVQKMIEKHNKQNITNRAKKFIMGDANVARIQHINERLDSSLLDLQLAMSVESSGREEKRSEQTAQTTVDLLLSTVHERAKESILLCVQCNKEYRQSENAEGSCKYHPNFPIYQNWKSKLECCNKVYGDAADAVGKEEGCIRGIHSSIHHFDYPYTAIFLWMRNQLYNNVKEEYLKVEDVDYEDNIPKYAVFGVAKNNKLFVAVGKGNFPLYLEFFSAEYPITAPDPSEVTGGNLWSVVTRGTDEQPSVLDKSAEVNAKWEVSAHWLVDFKTNAVTGIRLAAKSLSSKVPLIKALSFAFNPFVPGKPVLVSSAPYAPHAIYTHPLPPCNSKFVPFPESIFQDPPLEPEYETEIKGDLKLRLKKVGKVKANPETSGFTSDTFFIEIMVLNLSQGAHLGSSTEERILVLNMLKDGKVSVDEGIKLLGALDSSPHTDGPITMIELSARAYLDDKWVEPIALQVVPGGAAEENRAKALPFNVPPRNAAKLVVSCTFQAKDKTGQWFNKAFLARLSPVLLELTLEEMSGAKASVKSMFANPPAYFTPKKPDAWFWLEVDHVATWRKEHVAILPPDTTEGSMFQIEAPSMKWSITCVQLQTWGYHAWKENAHYFKLEDVKNAVVEAHGLVDLVNRVVCGFHFKIQCEDSIAEGIWMIPDDVMHKGRKSAVDTLIYETHGQTQPLPVDTPPGGWNKVAPKSAPASTPASATTSAPIPATSSSPSAARSQPPVPVRAKPAAAVSAPSPVTPPVPVVAKPAAAAAPPAAVPAGQAAEVLKAITPTPIVVAAPVTPASPAPNPKRGFKCSKCSFGLGKDECLKCKNRITVASPHANYCSACVIMNNNKCAKCGNVEVNVAARTPASLCTVKCAIGAAKNNCLKCGKFAPA